MERAFAAEKEAAQVSVGGLGVAISTLEECFPVGQAMCMASH